MTIATLGDFADTVEVDDLPEQISGAEVPAAGEGAEVHIGDLDSMERVMIERALNSCGGDQGLAAESLGISRRTLSRKLKIYRLEANGNGLGTLGDQQQRYFRAGLEHEVIMRSGNGHEARVRAVNVSASGIGLLEVTEPLRFTGIIDLEFPLGADGSRVSAKGKMTWADAQGHAGVRFVSLPPEAQRQLHAWLETRRQEEGWAMFE